MSSRVLNCPRHWITAGEICQAPWSGVATDWVNVIVPLIVQTPRPSASAAGVGVKRALSIRPASTATKRFNPASPLERDPAPGHSALLVVNRHTPAGAGDPSGRRNGDRRSSPPVAGDRGVAPDRRSDGT